MSPFPQTTVRYVVAVAAAICATIGRYFLTSVLGATQYPLITFYPAIMAAALYGGLGPGLLATGLCTVAVTPFMHLSGYNPADWVGLGIFVVTGVWISLFAESLHRAKHEAEYRLAERKLADEALKESEARKRAILESALDSVISIDHEGRLIEFNQAAEGTFGYTRESVFGKPIAELIIPPSLRERHHRGFARYFTTGETSVIGKRLEITAMRADGTEFPVELTVTRVGVKSPPTFTAFIRDITERKQAEEQFRLVVEAAPTGMVMVNGEGSILLVNMQLEKLFGYERSELVGQPIETLVPARFRGQHPGHRRGFFAAPSPRAMGAGRDLYGLRKDGNEFPVEIGLNPIETPDGIAVMASIIDITERKRSETELQDLMRTLEQRVAERTKALAEHARELARSNADLEKFAYASSHDLQEPLRMVTSYMQLLERRYKSQLDKRAQEYIGYAVDGAFRMRTLITDLLTYARVGAESLRYVPTDCSALLTECLENLKFSIKDSGARVTCDALPTVTADPTSLAQVFQNLLSNAIKYRRAAPPHIHVAAERKDGEVVLSVRDNGIGIDPEYFDRIFIIFQRLHTNAEYSGTGVGLAICKKIIERHGGRLWVDSKPGEGSTFYFTLPAAEEA